MALRYENLDEATRREMLRELALDVAGPGPRRSPLLVEAGRAEFVECLRAALALHDDAWLEVELRARSLLRERRRMASGDRGGVAEDGARVVAEGVFNVYYVRALCALAQSVGDAVVEVYRGHPTSDADLSVVRLVGQSFHAETLLGALRRSGSVAEALGLPAGCGEDLTVRLPSAEPPTWRPSAIRARARELSSDDT